MNKNENDAELLKAMGHPVRLKILRGIARDECSVSRIVDEFNLPQSTVSQHLAILRKCGAVWLRKEGVKTCYYLNDERVRKILQLL
jgi:ArsR family transcriptional regulator